MVIGPFNSGVVLATMPTYSAAGIPMVLGSATNADITKKGVKTVFRRIPTDAQNAAIAGKYAVSLAKNKRIAVLDDRTAFGQGETEEFVSTVKAAGGAAVLVAVAGDNPERLKSEVALAALCGTSPLQASSGKTVRHRLNRGGDRSANNALWTIAMVWMRSDPRTRAYVDRRTKEGMSNKEIHRCLKRKHWIYTVADFVDAREDRLLANGIDV